MLSLVEHVAEIAGNRVAPDSTLFTPPLFECCENNTSLFFKNHLWIQECSQKLN